MTNLAVRQFLINNLFFIYFEVKIEHNVSPRYQAHFDLFLVPPFDRAFGSCKLEDIVVNDNIDINAIYI